MSEYTKKRDAAIRRFYGNISEAEFPKYECNIWYVPTKDKCLAYEPTEREDDGFTSAVTKSTARNAMFEKPYTDEGI